MTWHIDCPYRDASWSNVNKEFLETEFTAHMKNGHGWDTPKATQYFIQNCHQIPVPV